jgi:glycosyltransferase involved in cell wall biosynthesis
MNKPFFSIIIPTLNEEKLLPKLLNDLSKQTEKDFEVITADGFSKDKTKRVAKDFNNKFDIRFYQTKLKNVAAQRNYGAQKSSGKYLVFLDADTRINQSFFKKVKKIILKKKGLAFIPYFLPDREYKQYKPLFDLSNILVEFSQNLPKRFSLGGSMIIEKNLFNIVGGFNEELFMAEDHELIQRISQWGVEVKFIREAKTYFSLRRMKKEGQIKYFYKYFISTAQRIFRGEIKDKIYDYQMGGQVYEKEKNVLKKEEFIQHYLKQIKDLFNQLIED